MSLCLAREGLEMYRKRPDIIADFEEDQDVHHENDYTAKTRTLIQSQSG